ncbi:MAG: hypothetical protein AAFO69_12140, partial [Bacteroidota bacterium]
MDKREDFRGDLLLLRLQEEALYPLQRSSDGHTGILHRNLHLNIESVYTNQNGDIRCPGVSYFR